MIATSIVTLHARSAYHTSVCKTNTRLNTFHRRCSNVSTTLPLFQIAWGGPAEATRGFLCWNYMFILKHIGCPETIKTVVMQPARDPRCIKVDIPAPVNVQHFPLQCANNTAQQCINSAVSVYLYMFLCVYKHNLCIFSCVWNTVHFSVQHNTLASRHLEVHRRSAPRVSCDR